MSRARLVALAALLAAAPAVAGESLWINEGNRMRVVEIASIDAPPLCLHAFELTFQHPVTRQPVTFRAPPPAWADMG